MPPIVRILGVVFLIAHPISAAGQPLASADYGHRGQVMPAAYEAPLETGDVAGHPGEPAASPTEDALARPLSPPKERVSLPLAAPGSSGSEQRTRSSGLPSLVSVIGSLAIVLGIFLVVAWGMRRAAPAGATILPGEVFTILGRASTGNRQQVQLFRCGNKLLLVSVSAAGVETLTEITDPVEVDRLAGLCEQAQPNSATEAFRQVFSQFAPQRPSSSSFSGLFGKGRSDDLATAGGVSATDDRLEGRHV